MKKNNMFRPQNLSAEAIQKAVKEFFGKVSYELETMMVGNVCYLKVAYTDFKPRRQVRNDLEDLAPNIEVEEIERGFSDRAIVTSYLDLEDKMQEFYIKMDDGSMRPATIGTILCQNLAHKTLCRESDFRSMEQQETE